MNAQKPWLQHYPEGVPYEASLKGYQSLVHLLEESLSRYGARTALESLGQTVSYHELDRLSQDFASYLQSLQLAPGSRIAIMMPNLLQYLIAMLGTLRAGYAVVNVSPLYTARELEHQLLDSGASVLVILENFAHLYQSIQGHVQLEQVVVSSIGDILGIRGAFIDLIARKLKKLVPAWSLPCVALKDALRIGRQHSFSKPAIMLDDIAFLQYTGGTTGVSKGAVLTQRNLLANVLQIEDWLEPGLKQNTPKQLIFLCALPFTHIFALTACAFLGMRKGGKLLLVANPRDIPRFIRLLIQHPNIHIFPGVNTLFHALIHHPLFTKVKLPDLLVTIGGGMAVQKTVADRWQKLTGVPIAQGYGLSETSPVVCVNTPLIESFTGSIGLPISGTEVIILDDDEVELPYGSPGEICIRGPQVMQGYWQRVEESKQCFTSDGFFKSGDIGIMSQDGYVQIVDRKKDMVVVAGFKVFPNEVEEVLSQLPGVRECAVVGVPHRKLGEIVKAFIVKDDHHLSEKAVHRYCREQLSTYKRPRRIQFVDELPKSNVGKIVRRHLKAL